MFENKSAEKKRNQIQKAEIIFNLVLFHRFLLGFDSFFLKIVFIEHPKEIQ